MSSWLLQKILGATRREKEKKQWSYATVRCRPDQPAGGKKINNCLIYGEYCGFFVIFLQGKAVLGLYLGLHHGLASTAKSMRKRKIEKKDENERGKKKSS